MAEATAGSLRPLPGAAANWLIAALLVAMLPHFAHLPPWLTGLFLVAAGWRWGVAWRGLALPGRWLLAVITLCGGASVALSFGTLFGRDAGVALLTAMAAMKLLESRRVRDGMVLTVLGFFLVMANLLYTQSLLAAAHVLVAVALLLGAQLITRPAPRPQPVASVLGLVLRIIGQSAPVMLVLFVLFPRIQGPLWGLPDDAHSGLTGLSGDMTPGAISTLSQSGAVAFRVRFAGPIPAPQKLYWRGPILWHFDGRTWHTVEERPLTSFSYTRLGEPVDYAVILEPHGNNWLFALDLPGELPYEARVTASNQLLRRDRVTEVVRYEMRSYLAYRTDPMPSWQRWRSVHLPRHGDPRARRLAAAWRDQEPDPAARVNRALDHFRERPFYYTLNPPLLGEDAIDQFLFETRRGFCEHYAGAFVFLMRAAGVPARVVTGYQGGELNELGQYMIVRQSDAHAWAEVWLEGRGWVRVDPVAAVAPERVERGIYAALGESEALPFLARRGDPWLRNLALGWDSINNAWNEWVLAYGPERQREVLSGLGFGPVDWRWMTTAMVASLGLLGAAYLLVHALRDRRRADPLTRAYRRFATRLARAGIGPRPYEGPIEFARRAGAARPDLAHRVRLISELYARQRFGPHRSGDALRRLRRLIRGLRV